MSFIRNFAKNSKGATAIEYGLIAALIAIAAIVGFRAVGTSLNSTFEGVSTTLDDPKAAADAGAAANPTPNDD